MVKLLIEIPDEVYEAYERQGDTAIPERLVACVKHTSKKPIYIDDTTRQELERLLGRNFSSAKQLVDYIRRILSIKLSEVEVSIQPILLTRLKSRCFGKPFPEFLKERVVRGLEEFTMMS